MRRGWLLVLMAMVLGSSAAEQDGGLKPTPILAFYDFEEEAPSGPDTFRLFERPGGQVALSEAFRVSGSRSLRLKEGRGDGSFSEFLGTIPERRQGPLLVRFYILFADPNETFNFALAGPRWFKSFVKDGHAFWLATADGKLVHHPAQGFVDLFVPRPFTWYLVDLLLDLDLGTYDLAIYEEGLQEPRAEVRGQRLTSGVPGSAVAFYSFIGDLEDRGAATFFVDDLLLATDPGLRLAPFVAPGRRRYFVESLGWPVLPAAQSADLLAQARSWLRAGAVAEPESFDRWERAAGEAFLAGDLDLAGELFSRLLADPSRINRVLLKLADVYHLRGWVEEERRARERIFGRLELAE